MQAIYMRRGAVASRQHNVRKYVVKHDSGPRTTHYVCAWCADTIAGVVVKSTRTVTDVCEGCGVQHLGRVD